MIKVFLVEDEYAIREGIKKSVNWEQNGFELVGEAGDGEVAFPKIMKTEPDILITDIRMPFMDGLELSRLVKKEMPNIRIIVTSLSFSPIKNFEIQMIMHPIMPIIIVG